MKLYFYYLSDRIVKKDIITNVRENKRNYTIPNNKSKLSALYEWKLSKECCEKVQVDSSVYGTPFIISIKNNLNEISGLNKMLQNLAESCAAINDKIKEIEI